MRPFDCVDFMTLSYSYAWESVRDFMEDRNGVILFDPHVDWATPRLFGSCSSDPMHMDVSRPRDMSKYDRSLVTAEYWERLENDSTIFAFSGHKELVDETTRDYLKNGQADFTPFSTQGLTQIRQHIGERLRVRRKNRRYTRRSAQREDLRKKEQEERYQQERFVPPSASILNGGDNLNVIKEWAQSNWNVLQMKFGLAVITLRFRNCRYAINLAGPYSDDLVVVLI